MITEELTEYQNGNTLVTIFNCDGTKIRITPENIKPMPEFPETIDLKITNKCDLNCEYCHEQSVSNGKHADLDYIAENLSFLPEGIELAIGGGNPLEHPKLIKFLNWCKNIHRFIPNLTINGNHVSQIPIEIFKKELIYGLGISYIGETENLIKKYFNFKYPNCVSHLIIGVHNIDDVRRALSLYGKILILGYKKHGRGTTYTPKYYNDFINNFYKFLQPHKINGVVSFDNLAIEQLQLKNYFSSQQWDEFYMGDDGTFSMYYNAVDNYYSSNSNNNNAKVKDTVPILEFFKGDY